MAINRAINTEQELAFRYARYVDDKDFDKMNLIMAPDIVMASPGFETHGLKEFQDLLVENLKRFSVTMHLVGNQLGQWQGDNYEGETYCVASHIYEQDATQWKMEMAIRYQDSIALIDGQHLYTRRYLNVLWESNLPLAG